jgi:hypothetical protein
MNTTHVPRFQVPSTPCVGCPKLATCFGAFFCPRKIAARKRAMEMGSDRTA